MTVVAIIVAAIISVIVIKVLRGKAHKETAIATDSPGQGWCPSHDMEHRGVRLTELPFIPRMDEVIYVEAQYDEAANEFIRRYRKQIEARCEEKGFRFVYMPDMHASDEICKATIMSLHPEGADSGLAESIERFEQPRFTSGFLYDYMLYPEGRMKCKTGLAWFNCTRKCLGVLENIYDYISFDGKEALEDPEGVLDDIFSELGECNDWMEGLCKTIKNNTPDSLFYSHTTVLLREVREKLDEIRLSGVNEALIMEYIMETPRLSRLVITHDLRIFMPDYENKEVVMEPLNRAVFLLFLRHPEGLYFKELTDHSKELEIIYESVRKGANDIDGRLAAGEEVELHKSIANVVDPTSNLINEKCSRIKEAFLLMMNDRIAENYYITGKWGERKHVALPTDMIIWENKDAERTKEEQCQTTISNQ